MIYLGFYLIIGAIVAAVTAKKFQFFTPGNMVVDAIGILVIGIFWPIHVTFYLLHKYGI